MSGELHIELATARDVRTVAALHIASLPESMISMLGPRSVERYYDLVTTSATEHVFVMRADVVRSDEDQSRQDAKIAKQKLAEETDEVAAEHETDPSTSAWRSRRLGGSSSGAGTGAARGSASAATPGIAAACVLALEPGTVMGRFVRHAPVAFAADLARRSLDAAFRRRLLARLEEGGGAAGTGVPEVTQIFTDGAQRGRGLGSALLRACEDRLRALGHLTYCIHTLRDANDAGIRFYRREGFTDTGSSRSFGDHYLVMTKGLT